ncbi:hypothetical protein SFRURICE_005970 [Spodoptera frugiperda]|nr:hypothetical protein SFRURICE_005970 [Spodoptera frugiperda]
MLDVNLFDGYCDTRRRLQRHAFYPRKGRQRCTLQHVNVNVNAAIQCTPTFHHLCYKSQIIGVILCPTRESNPRPLVQQSHSRLLYDQICNVAIQCTPFKTHVIGDEPIVIIILRATTDKFLKSQ